MGPTRKRGDVRVAPPVLSSEPLTDTSPEGGGDTRRKQANVEAQVERCERLLDNALDGVQRAWSGIEDGASIDAARPEIVKATAALIGVRRELGKLRRPKK
jgi:hypothetical protein